MDNLSEVNYCFCLN